MAKIRKPTEADISAMTSNDVAIKRYRNQTVISTITWPKESKSEKRKKSNDRLASASHWASGILQDPALKKLYSKGISEKLPNAHTVAIKDYLNAPTIHYISLKQHTGTIGDTIRIKATDDFQVTAVRVRITGRNGELLEQGSAARDRRKPLIWVYTLTAANPEPEGTVIEVTAMDRAENKDVKKEIVGKQLPAQ